MTTTVPGTLALIALLGCAGCGGGAKGTGSGGAGAGTAGSTTTASTAGSTTGTGGGGASSSAGSGGATSSSTGSGGGPTAMACQSPPCINVINGCPFPLWIHAAANQGATLMPDDAELAPGGEIGSVRQYDVPASWPAARVSAYWVDPNGPSPDPTAYDKVEVTVGGGVMNYNITYVDYAALPSRMEAVGPSCAKTSTFDPRVTCDVPASSLLAGCPSGLLAGKRCLSAGLFCSMGQNAASAYCHALDAQIAACAQQNPSTCGIAAQLGNTTVNVYGCSGYFDSQPPNCSPASATCHQDGNEWCAALNRGMLASPMSTDATQYYVNAPYSTYAKWVHATCPGIYAFPYDDYPSGAGQSGFRSCTADRLDITFCPAG
jgi:hypothetical protein